MCLWAQNKPNDASAFQYNPQALLFLHWTSDNVLSAPYFLSDVSHAYLKNKMKKYQLNLKRI